MDNYFKSFFTFTHTTQTEKGAYFTQGWGEAVEEKQAQTKEQELITEKSTVSTLSAYAAGKQCF